MRIYKSSIILFSIFWFVFIFFDYWQKHPYYYINLINFSYYDLTAVLTLLGVGTYFLIKKVKNQAWRKWLNGLSLFGAALFIIALSVQFYINKTNLPMTNGGSVLHLLGMVIQAVTSVYLVTLCAYVIGELIWRLFSIPIKGLSKDIVLVAIGIMGLVSILFLLGIFSLLVWYILIPIFVFILGIRWKISLDFLKRTLITPIQLPNELNGLGIASFYILFIIISWTIMQVCMPFPRGWDALSLYVSLPSLINDYQGLVSGYQPYNWSLIMSLGFVLFGKMESTLMLSYLGGFLTLFSLYQLARTLFKMDVNFSFLTLCIFSLIPSIAFQTYLEQKVDLGLLFILTAIVLVLINWIEHHNKDINTVTVDSENHRKLPFIQPAIALMGLLTGFALGIKLTALFTFFGILATMWYVLKGNLGFLALFAVSIFAIFLLKIDDQSGLRAYHLSASAVQWIMLIIGLGLAVYIFVKDKKTFLYGFKLSVIYGLFFVLPILPWLTKNYSETKRLDVNSLLNGQSNAPKISAKQLISKWKQQ